MASGSVQRRVRKQVGSLKQGVSSFVALVGVASVCTLVDAVVAYPLTSWGIVPRSAWGLVGIVTAPLLHGSVVHLLTNALSFLVLGGIVRALHGRRTFWRVTWQGTVTSGVVVWLIGSSDSVTVGASGVIYAYLGYLMAWGVYRGRVLAVVLSVVVMMLFGGLLWGLLPLFVPVGVSWQSHLGGFVGGVLAARMLATTR